MVKHKGKISIFRVSGQSNDGHIGIELYAEDHTIVSITSITLENFALALTGRGGIECDVENFLMKGKDE